MVSNGTLEKASRAKKNKARGSNGGLNEKIFEAEEKKVAEITKSAERKLFKKRSGPGSKHSLSTKTLDISILRFLESFSRPLRQ